MEDVQTTGVGGVGRENTVSGYTSQVCSVTLVFPGRAELVLCPYAMERGSLAWSPPWLYSGVCTLRWYQLGFCLLVWFGFSMLLEKGYLGIFFLVVPLDTRPQCWLLAVTPLLDCDAH